MSIVRDAQGNILNPQNAARKRYTDDSLSTIDWFTLHPEDKPKSLEPVKLPSAADLDAVAAEQAAANATAGSNNDVSQVQLPSGQPVAGLAPESAVPESATASGNTTSNLPQAAVVAGN